MNQKEPSTALSKTTTLTCSSVSIAVMISFTCGSISGPKMLSGGWSNVTLQYSGERWFKRISLISVAAEFSFFMFVVPLPGFIFDPALRSSSGTLSSRGFDEVVPHRESLVIDHCEVLLRLPSPFHW